MVYKLIKTIIFIYSIPFAIKFFKSSTIPPVPIEVPISVICQFSKSITHTIPHNIKNNNCCYKQRYQRMAK